MKQLVTLDETSNYIALESPNDATTHLCRDLTKIAIARTLHGARELGIDVQMHAVVGCDSAPSRNPQRLQGGFTAGGKMSWTSDTPIYPLDSIATGCGMAYVALSETPEPAAVLQRLRELQEAPPRVDGISLHLDIGRKNHFLGTFSEDSGGRTLAVVHCSIPEVRSGGPDALGLNVTASESLRRTARTLDTPWGQTQLLIGRDVEPYLQSASTMLEFGHKKRSTILQTVFEPWLLGNDVVDRAHQGPLSANLLTSGYQSAAAANEPYIVLLGPNEGAALVEVPSARGVEIPHSTGHTFTGVNEAHADWSNEFNRIRLSLRSKSSTMDYFTPPEIPFDFRDISALDASPIADLWRGAARLRNAWTTRI